MSTDRSTRILVVDNEPGIRDVLAYFLIGEGYAVSVASDGHVALEMAMEQSPHLVLTDVMMPRLSGPELYALLRHQGYRGPVILMTADRGQSAALAAHPAPVLRKPFDLNHLLATINDALTAGASTHLEAALDRGIDALKPDSKT